MLVSRRTKARTLWRVNRNTWECVLMLNNDKLG